MNELKRKGFRELDLDARVTLLGQLLLTCGTAFLSLGQIFKLLKADELPTTPIDNQSSSPRVINNDSSLYGGRKSYFES